MKMMFLSIGLLMLSFGLFSQDINGTWAGVFSSQTRTFPKNYYFFLELKQKGKTVWGTYNTSDSMNNLSISCLCSVSGIIHKKTPSTLDLYKYKLEAFDKHTANYARCNEVNRLTLHYFIRDSIEYLTGQWYTELELGYLPGGASGSFVVQHINSQAMHDVDQYFPKLNKLIQRGITQERIAIKPDDSSAATANELKLLDAIRTLIRNRTP